MQVKINSYITTSDLTEEQAIEQATSMVEAYDVINENRIGEVVTKLYYIVPILGKILVVVNDADRDILGVESNILANTDISDYPLERLPASVIDYKELIVKVGSSLTMEQIFNAGQSVVEETASKSMPYKIPVLKVINYNNTDVDALVMPSIFGSNIFSSIGGIVNGGDAEAGTLSLTSVIRTESNLTFNNNFIDTGIAEQVNQTIFIDAVQTGFVGGDGNLDGLLGLHNVDHGVAIQGSQFENTEVLILGVCNTNINSSKRFKIALVMGDTYCKIFIDGALASESSNPFIPYNGNINIGRSYNNRNFTGTVYRYSIHSRVLTDNECIKLTSIQE